MSLWKLRLSMLGTLAIIIAVSTGFFALILEYLGLLDIASLIVFVALFNVVQWLFAPHLINALYRVRQLKDKRSRLYRIVERLSMESGIKMPTVGIANIPIPNAFAYGSPICGSRMAVTKGLLDTLEDEEIEAVLGHELGHLKHRDVQVMMLVSFLPSLFYLIGRSAMFSAYYGSDRRQGAGTALIGTLSMVMYFVLTLFTLRLSRLREYYADRHSVSIVEDGSRKLSESLAKIAFKTGRIRMKGSTETFTLNSFKSLFISDPDMAEKDAAQIVERGLAISDQGLVERLLSRKVTTGSRMMEIFSTHPNITKRLRALQDLS